MTADATSRGPMKTAPWLAGERAFHGDMAGESWRVAVGPSASQVAQTQSRELERLSCVRGQAE